MSKTILLSQYQHSSYHSPYNYHTQIPTIHTNIHTHFHTHNIKYKYNTLITILIFLLITIKQCTCEYQQLLINTMGNQMPIQYYNTTPLTTLGNTISGNLSWAGNQILQLALCKQSNNITIAYDVINTYTSLTSPINFNYTVTNASIGIYTLIVYPAITTLKKLFTPILYSLKMNINNANFSSFSDSLTQIRLLFPVITDSSQTKLIISCVPYKNMLGNAVLLGPNSTVNILNNFIFNGSNNQLVNTYNYSAYMVINNWNITFAPLPTNSTYNWITYSRTSPTFSFKLYRISPDLPTKSPLPIILGIVIPFVVIIIAVIAILCYCRRRRQKEEEKRLKLENVMIANQQTAKQILRNMDAFIMQTLTTNQCFVCLLKQCNSYLPCAHVFHYQCLIDWKEKTDLCPVCSQTFTMEEIRKIDPNKKLKAQINQVKDLAINNKGSKGDQSDKDGSTVKGSVGKASTGKGKGGQNIHNTISNLLGTNKKQQNNVKAFPFTLQKHEEGASRGNIL